LSGSTFFKPPALPEVADYSDARWLAHLLRLGVLPEGYIYNEPVKS